MQLDEARRKEMLRPATAGALRPATAGSQRSAMDIRPLGRSPMPARLQAAVQTNNIATQIAALKGEIVMLQHRFHETRLSGECRHEMETLEKKLMTLSPVFPDDGTNLDIKCSLLEIMIEQIKSISVAALERSGIDGVAVSSQAATAETTVLPSRTHTFLKLVEFIISLADRKRVWDTRLAQEGVSAAPVSLQQLSAPVSGVVSPAEAAGAMLPPRPSSAARSAENATDLNVFDLAMNEPTAAEVRKLAAEQRQLQEQIKAMLTKSTNEPRRDGRRGTVAPGMGMPGTPALAIPAALSASAAAGAVSGMTPEPSARGPGPMGEVVNSVAAQQLQNLQAKIDVLLEENLLHKKRIAQLEDSLKDSKYAEKVEYDEVPVDVAKRVRGLAFGSDYPRLLELGVSVPAKPIITDESGERFAARVSTLLAEFSVPFSLSQNQQVGSAAAVPAKGAKDAGNAKAKQQTNAAGAAADSGLVGASAPTVLEGLLWGTLTQQSKLLTDTLNRVKVIKGEMQSQLDAKDGECTRLQRVIATLEQRVQLVKTQAAKEQLVLEAEAANIRKDVERFKKLYEDALHAQTSASKRIVNAKGQVATAEERERTLKEEIASRQQSIGDLTEQLRALKLRIEQEQATTASVVRERLSLLQSRDAEAMKVQRLQMEAKEREEILQNTKEALLMLKKEMREKSVVDTETQQKLWKLEVELHIAQNVIAELRQRESELQKTSRDAESCREELQEEVYRLRDEIADQQASMHGKLEEAQQELRNAKSMLTEERQKLMAQEKEVERLRILDIKMESLEQNFTNYAASKIAQREAGEEEERVLGACLEALEKDPFIVPKEQEGEAIVQLHIRELQTAKEQFEADERVRKRSRGFKQQQDDEATNKKKLILLLQSRLTEIQLFACQHRLQQMSNERRVRDQHLEIQQMKASQEALLNELSQVRLQCEALAHRNSELEMERKQFMKQRSTMESEVKGLKANAQRLRVSHDEQEKLLVDMGSKLQSARMHVDATEGKISPLPQAVLGVE